MDIPEGFRYTIMTMRLTDGKLLASKKVFAWRIFCNFVARLNGSLADIMSDLFNEHSKSNTFAILPSCRSPSAFFTAKMLR